MNTNENDNDIILPCSVNTKHSKENISKIGNVLVILTVYSYECGTTIHLYLCTYCWKLLLSLIDEKVNTWF